MPGYLSTSSEFVANSEITGSQDQPRIAHFSNGNYIVVWSTYDSANPDNTGTIKAQLFDSFGNRIGSEFQVNSFDYSWQSAPEVTVLADNSFVVVWQTDDNSRDGWGRAVVGQRFDATGSALGNEFVVNTSTAGFQSTPHLSALAGGGFVVAWDDTYTHTVRAQTYAANGATVGGETVLASYNATYNTMFDLQPQANGGYVVSWTTSTATGNDVRAQFVAANGALAGSAFTVNSLTTGNQEAPHIVVLANGNFLVAWTTYDTTQDGSNTAIKARLFDAAGNALGSEFLVNQAAAGYQYSPQLSALPDGGFIAVWSTWPVAGSWDNSLVARTFDAAGQPTGNEFQVNSFSPDTQYLGGITTLPDGRVLVAFSTYGAEGLVNDGGILIHTLAPTGPNAVAPSIISNGGGASAVVAVNEYTSLATFAQAYDPDGPQTTTFAITGGADAARFTINTITGRLAFVSAPEFANPADANADNVYDVVVTASDGTLSDTQALQVVVQDVDETIAFGGPAQFQSNENEQVAGSVTASSAAALPIYYQIVGGDDAALLSIDPFTGLLYFNNAPDFENPGDANGDNSYAVQVMASNGVASSTAAFVVQVQDLVDGSIFASPDAVAITENNDYVVTVQAVSNTESFLYTITGGEDAGLFQIDQQTGNLYFASAPDYDAPLDLQGDNAYQVEVTAWGQLSGSPATQLISVTVQNVDEAPIFLSTQYPIADENQTNALQVQAYDPEGGAIVYSIYNMPGVVDDAVYFTIDPNTGQLSFIGAPDFEAPNDYDGDNMYHVYVAALDLQGTWLSVEAVVVEVANVNEAPEMVQFGPANLLENSTFVGALTATDVDGDSLTWSITGGADAANFGINPTTGELYFASMPNYEAPADSDGNNVYEVQVSASDGSLSSVQTVTVTVGNANEAPLISAPSTFFVINENTSAVATFSAVDPDGTAPTFVIAGGADAARFTINSATGALSFTSAPNYEAFASANHGNLYEVVVAASDGSLSTAVGIQVAVQNINEAPIITSSSALAVNENTTAIATLTATDPEGSPRTWSITGGSDAARFTINSATGALSFVSPRNYESPTDTNHDNVYQVQVTASDGILSSSQLLSVTVNNVNETPFITSNGGGASATLSVAENGAAVTTVTSGDPDGTSPSYSIIGGADAALFTIDAATGVLAFVSAPNYEAPLDANGDNAYEVTVRASDGTLSDTQAVTVTVSNVNEGPAITSSGSFTVAENGSTVATLAGSDPDGTALAWTISGGADAARFTINAATGALSFISAPNYEAPGDAGADNVYDVIVSASDGLLAATQAIAVAVGNANEGQNVPPGQGFTASENSTGAGIFTATDLDGDALSYAISGGADAARFTINSVTGAVSFITAPNFEAPADSNGDNVYDLVITASDGSISTNGSYSVTVGNVNEAPVITGSTSLAASEGSTAVATLSSTDPENNPRTWLISGGADAARFVINAATGALSFAATPDYEAPADSNGDNQYLVQVTVSDGNLTASQLFTISLGNVNEAPLITSNGGGTSAAISVGENSATVTTVTSTDPEGTARTYSIVGGADAARFAINAATGALSFIAPPNYEAPNDAGANNVYDVIVAASDGFLTDTQALAITVGNVNEAPVITSNGGGDTASLTINENTFAVTSVTSTDSEGTARTYSIAGGADAARFTINSTTGALSFIAAPNWEVPTDSNADNIYNVIVAASDGTLTDTQALAVTVGNVVDGSTINGTNAANTLTGTVAEDTINGLNGNDTITGGLGADVLTGGSGADTFVYSALNHSSLSAPDRITDFSLSQNDRISLSGIDANAGLAGDQAFSWIGTGNFTNVAGQLRYYQQNGHTYVTGDVNGDGVGDFLIQLDPAVTLSASYFVL